MRGTQNHANFVTIFMNRKKSEKILNEEKLSKIMYGKKSRTNCIMGKLQQLQNLIRETIFHVQDKFLRVMQRFSNPEVVCKKGVLKYFEKFLRNTCTRFPACRTSTNGCIRMYQIDLSKNSNISLGSSGVRSKEFYRKLPLRFLDISFGCNQQISFGYNQQSFLNYGNLSST